VPRRDGNSGLPLARPAGCYSTGGPRNYERFLTQQKPLLVDLLGLRIKAMRTASMFCRCTDTGGTRSLLLQHRTISFKLLAKSVTCLFARSPPCTKVCTKTSLSLYYTLCFCVKQCNFHLLIYSQPPVVRHFTNWCADFQLWSVLTVYDIYRIFHELQRLLARLQHPYYDVTILMEL